MQNEEPQMTDISMIGPDGGEQMLTGDAVAGVMARYDTVPATDFAALEGAQ
jgi:hypothetical protein